MGRLKGLDEMERTGLEMDWDKLLSANHSDNNSPHGRSGFLTKTRLIGAGLAAIVILGGGYAFNQGLLPTGDQIRSEMNRRQAVLTQMSGQESSQAIRPGIGGLDQPLAKPDDAEFYRQRLGVPFPGGTAEILSAPGPGLPLMPIDIVDMTGNALPKTIKIRDLTGDRIWAIAYLAPDKQFQLHFPAGGYRISVAEGSAWFSPDEQFGPEGRYYAPQALDLRHGQHLRIELPPAGSGVEQQRISKDNF